MLKYEGVLLNPGMQVLNLFMPLIGVNKFTLGENILSG
jgi:hypothetical protein